MRCHLLGFTALQLQRAFCVGALSPHSTEASGQFVPIVLHGPVASVNQFSTVVCTAQRAKKKRRLGDLSHGRTKRHRFTFPQCSGAYGDGREVTLLSFLSRWKPRAPSARSTSTILALRQCICLPLAQAVDTVCRSTGGMKLP